MPLNIIKKSSPKPGVKKKAVKKAMPKPSANKGFSHPKKKGLTVVKGDKKKQSFHLKRGKAAHDLLVEEERREAVREEKRNRLRRFYLPAKADATITFVDGDLDEDGLLDAVMFMEHQVQIGNDFRNWFVCIKEEEPCPLCMDKVSNPYLAGALTIIDHSEFEFQGQTYKNQKRLYVFKKRTLELLLAYAKEYGGLSGTTWHVKRSSSDVANVGDVMLFRKKRTLGELAKVYPNVKWDAADYETEIPYHSAEELQAMGYGQPGIGSEEEIQDEASTADEEL